MSEWISVADKLPTEGKFYGNAVLVWMRPRPEAFEWKEYSVYGVASVSPKTGEWIHWYVGSPEMADISAYLNERYEITHWRDFPAPPEEA